MKGTEGGPGARRILVVLGMHRSGTSALTRGLQVLGVDLGQHLIGAVPGNNDKGFWEDADINAFDDALLRELGSGWDRLNVPDAMALPQALEGKRAEGAKLLQAKLADGAIFAFKDPRTAVLLPFWQQVFADLGLHASYVVAVRNPAEVAHSLARRDGMGIAKGILLWIKYSMAAVRGTEGDRRVFVAYGSLMEHPERQLARIARELELPGPEEDPAALLEYTEEFLSPDLRRNVLPPSALVDPAQIPPLVSEFYAVLEDLAADRVRAEGEEWARRWTGLEQQYANLVPLLNGMDAAERAGTTVAAAPDAPQQPASTPAAPKAPALQPLRSFHQHTERLRPQFHQVVHRWNLESVKDGTACLRSGQRLLVAGWVWPTAGGHTVRLATRQQGVTRSYPLNVQRPDVVQAMQAEVPAAATNYCGFQYSVKAEAGFEIGFEIDGWLFWLYSGQPVIGHDPS